MIPSSDHPIFSTNLEIENHVKYLKNFLFFFIIIWHLNEKIISEKYLLYMCQ